MNFGEGLLIVVAVIIGFVLAVVALVAGMFFLLRWWITRKVKGFMTQMADSGNLGRIFETMQTGFVPTPPRVHLHKREKIEWRDEAAVERLAAPLRAHCFEPVGDFMINEMPGVLLRVLHDPTQRFYAVVYDYAPASICYVDLHARLESGGTLTVTNAPQGEEIETHPAHRKIFLKNADIHMLIERMNAELAQNKIEGATAEAFVAEFEKSYAESMDFILGRGGPTLEEMRRGARLRGETVDEATLRAAHATSKTRNAILLEDIVREKFLEQSTMSATRWEELRNRLMIVHDHHSLDDVLSKYWQIRSSVEDDEENVDQEIDYEARGRDLKAKVQGLPARQAFTRLLVELPASKRPELLDSISEPVQADLYTEPATSSHT